MQADANKAIMNKEAAAEAMTVLDGNESPLGYMADALAAVAAIVVHAEKAYGPFITDTILNALEGGTIRNKINEGRNGKADV